MNKKAFTLIELLAVIVILAIIAVIAVPIVLNIINDSKENAILRSADFYLDGLELSIAQATLKDINITDGTYIVQPDGNLCPNEGKCTADNKIEVNVSGSKPTGGIVVIENSMIISYKNLYINEKYVSGSKNSSSISDKAVKQLDTLCIPATAGTVTTGNIPSGNYANGDEYICEVKNGTLYHFFVIGKTDSGEINLIVDRNMKEGGVPATSKADNPAWISVEDYNNDSYPKVNAFCNADASHTCYSAGPITALNYLDKAVENWTNIPLNSYSLEQRPVLGSNSADYTATPHPEEEKYPSYTISRTTRARLITVQELENNGCKYTYNETIDGVTIRHNVTSCPLYMVNYLEYKYYNNGTLPEIGVAYPNRTSVAGIRAYWTSSVQPGDITATDGDCAIIAHDNGRIDCEYTVTAQYAGVRPVITLSTSDLG